MFTRLENSVKKIQPRHFQLRPAKDLVRVSDVQDLGGRFLDASVDRLLECAWKQHNCWIFAKSEVITNASDIIKRSLNGTVIGMFLEVEIIQLPYKNFTVPDAPGIMGTCIDCNQSFGRFANDDLGDGVMLMATPKGLEIQALKSILEAFPVLTESIDHSRPLE